ncbi:hypothetical protein EV384_5477 [Micromonospora kangleipakensis]|uniref:Uncharacterized protein n=1 Tax=Micromonospora kangleipakensis TaxID=1077942 RepID=A0A4Q8BFP2_9ACTN|nr:hypothetical protein EV384_5477 [Micromonospora kangleipakensis]
MVTGVVGLRRQRSNRKRPLRTATSASLERVAAEIMQLESKIDEFVRDLGPRHLATMALRDSRDEAREVMASMRANDVREAKPTPVRVESDDRGADLLALRAIGAITLALPTVLPIGHVLTTWSLTLMPSLSADVDLGLQRRGVPGTQPLGVGAGEQHAVQAG